MLNECLETVKEASNALSSRALTYKKSKEKSHELKDAIADIEAKIEALASGADTSDVGTADNAADTSAADNGNGSETSGGCGSVMGTTAIIVAFTAVFGCAIVKKD